MPASHTLALIRRLTAIGLSSPPRRRKALPKQQQPDGIRVAYFTAIVRHACAPARAEVDKVAPEILREHREWYRRQHPKLVKHDAADGRTEAQKLIDKAQAKFVDNFQPHELERLASTFGEATTKFQKTQLDRQLRAAIGVGYNAIEKPTTDRVPQWAAENADLITTIPERYFDRLRAQVEDAYESGMSTDELEDEIEESYGVSESDAARIARDQVGKLNGQVNQDRQESLGITRFVWQTMNDDRVRETHAHLQGESFDWNDPPVDDVTGETITPGSAIQCVPGDALISLHAPALKAYRRRHVGELTEIISHGGEAVRTTPNHPLLTQRGWLAAHFVEVGDYLVEAPAQRFEIDVTDPQGCYATAAQMFGALAQLGISKRIAARGGFHGDAANEEIDVVDIDRHLLVDVMAEIAKARSDQPFPVSTNATTRTSKTSFPFVRSSDAADGDVGGLRDRLAFIGAALGHANAQRATTTAWLNAVSDQYAPHRSASAVQVMSDLELADAVRVRPQDFVLRKVKRVVSAPHDGFVYNFETITGWFSSHGRIIHNCRCYADPDVQQLLDDTE